MPTRPFTWLGIVVTVGWIVAWLRRLDTVEVRGGSMAPTLLPGDRLIVHRATGTPNVGDVVVAGDPRQPRRELVKRVVAIRDARVTVRGDNPDASTDSRAFGELPLAGVRWRVVARYWPPSRIGLIPPAPLQALGPVEGDRVEGSTIPTASVAGK
ncbi:MAG TPA: nickel-type superoxide dismutase maturation protease [Candidatus Limnocylindria bacterium]|nr:nickel-type superoxide dismutase maturation protease [Candidatus Limnocylindria bacterium]